MFGYIDLITCRLKRSWLGYCRLGLERKQHTVGTSRVCRVTVLLRGLLPTPFGVPLCIFGLL